MPEHNTPQHNAPEQKASDRYPGYDVLSKWDSVSFNDVTRAVLRRRLDDPPPRRFFSEAEWALMQALCAHLAPQPERGGPIPITPWIDADLQAGRGEGYRAPGVPPLQEAWRRGLAAIAAEARMAFGRAFEELGHDERETLCRQLNQGEARAPEWAGMPAKAFFAMLLNAVASHYASHPAAWSEMGFGGPAGPRGYVRLGLNKRDPWEAQESRSSGGAEP